MKRKAFILVLICLGLIAFFTSPSLAKKKLVRQASDQLSPRPYGAWFKPKLRADRQALLLIFGGMEHARNVHYSLTYIAASVPQGIEADYDPKNGNTQKELVFGTCSGTNCTYHQNLTDMSLTLTTGLTTGKILTQKYRIKP